MAELDTLPKDVRTPGPELRLLDRRAFVGFPPLELAPGVTIVDFALQIPDITFPLNLSGGASKYQKKRLDFGLLELSVDADVVHRRVLQVAGKVPELDELRLHFRPGYLEAQARLRGAERSPVTFKVAFDGDGEKLAIYIYDVRLYAFSTLPAARLPALISQALAGLDVLPEVERRGANGFTTRLLPSIVEQAAVGRGYKMPSLDQARLAEAVVSPKGLRLRFSSGGLPPPHAPDEDLLLALEGGRAFADAEELLAQGHLAEARAAYLKLGDATEAHPFAVERLLTLLVADGQAHEMALDIAASLLRRRENSATALWAEAVVRERRGEFARAAERYLALSTLSRRRQEEAGAFFAAEAAARASREHAPQMAVKALHELLGLKPDHLPSLKALARASDQAKDRAGAIRAYRRLAALARDPADAADAHVHLARLCAQAEDDLAGARLHCEAALRLSPDHPDALQHLGELCFRGGEHLRAIKALDRLRDVAMGRHEVDRVGRANLLAAQVWEQGLKQAENALLRYREAASLLPGESEPLTGAGRVAESLGRIPEAVAAYQQAVELAGPSPRTASARTAAHEAHHALSRLLKTRLGEPARAREHLEAALALDPKDTVALDELLPYFRAAGKAPELADACEKAAAVVDDPRRRAALWAEAGELYRGRLGQPEKAERLLGQALDADPKNRIALEGLLALAEAHRDGAQLCRCLEALMNLAEDGKERVRHARRLAVAARDLAFDLDRAARAFREVLRHEPDDLPALGELTALERRRADMAGLAWALEQRARAAEGQGDLRLAAAALRELGQVLDVRLGRAGEALVALQKASRLVPDASALVDLAALCLRLERPNDARRALDDALALLPRHAAPEKLADIRARLGQACELTGDKDAAREHYLAAFPARRLDDDLARRLEGLLLESSQVRELTDFWAARAQALHQAGRQQDAAPLYVRAARAQLQAGDVAGAMLKFGAALEAAPQGAHAAEVLEAMAQVELDRGAAAEAARAFARRAALAPQGREAARWYFKAATLTRDTAREAGYLAQTLEQDAAFVPARLRRADLSATAQPREALTDLEVVLAADPRDPDVLALELDRAALTRRLAFGALALGDLDAARRHLSACVAQRPDDLEALLELATLHRRAGALEPLLDLLASAWPRLTGAARTSARKEFAEGALSLGRRDAAAEALRSMLLEEPQDAWAAGRLLSLLPTDASSSRERLDLLGRLIATAQGEARGQLLARRAGLHREAHELLLARADLLDAAQLVGQPAPLLRELAELCRQSGDEAAELSAWRLLTARSEAGKSDLADAASRLPTLAGSRAAAQDFARAAEAWEAVVALPLPAPEAQSAWLGLAAVAKALGQGLRAEEALWQASHIGVPALRVEALLERAALLEARGALEPASESFEAALELSPGQPVAVEGLERTLSARGDWEALTEVLAARAAKAPPADAVALFRRLAQLYLEQLTLTGPAESALRRVVALAPDDVAARRSLARLVEARGEVLDASALLEEAAAALPAPEAASLLREAAALAARETASTRELRLLRRAHALVAAEGTDLSRLADLLYLQGAVREVLPLVQQLARAVTFFDDPEEAERLQLWLADLHEQLGHADDAEAALRLVVQERPLSTRAVERLAAAVSVRDPRAAVALLARHVVALAPTARRDARLLELARDATRLGELELAGELFGLAASAAAEPLPIRLELAAAWRSAGRAAELLAVLPDIAQQQLAQGQVDAALATWDEEARLAESLGRLDEAVRTLTAMAEVCEEEGRAAPAAALLLRLATLHRDARLDLDAAAAAFDRAFELEASPSTAQAAMELARRRGDREAEIDWLERSLPGVPSAHERALAFVRLARLHLGLPADGGDVASAPLLAPEQCEAALQQALVLVPALPEAEALLLALYERQDRVLDLAAFRETAAARETQPARRAALLLEAAALYKDRAGRPHEAVAALLAARAADPEDVRLTERVADTLHGMGRAQDAADFDSLLLEADPFHPAWARHRAWLEQSGDDLTLAALLSRRAEREAGGTAADTWLDAAAAFHRAQALERAHLCESQAFEADAGHREAFERLLAQAQGDARREASVLAARARAVPSEADGLLRRRAQALSGAREALLAASAWDEYLALSPRDLEALEVRAQLAFDGGGARASQPYDRRLLQVGGEALSPALALQTWWRLGQAALDAQAWRDAAEALEQVVARDAEGERGREALPLLAEAYSHQGDAAGQYRTALRQARRLTGPEAEAMFRRAVTFAASPADAREALEVLLAWHPAEEALYRQGLAAYRALGRPGDEVALHERYAAAVGGPAAAQALLAAARVLEQDLRDGARAFELQLEAVRLDPADTTHARTVLDELRRRGDLVLLSELLPLLAERAADAQTASGLQLEWADVLERRGQPDAARDVFEALRRAGPSHGGYAQALAGLERLATQAGDAVGAAAWRVEAATLLSPAPRAAVLLGAARVYLAAGQLERARELAQGSLQAHATGAAASALVDVVRATGDQEALARALSQQADFLSGDDQALALMEASETWAALGQAQAARDALEHLLLRVPTALTWRELAERFTGLGAPRRALELGYAPALAEGDLDAALKLAEAAPDDGLTREVLWRQVARDGAPAAAQRLAAHVRQTGDAAGLERLASAVVARDAALARTLHLELLFTHRRLAALDALETLGALDEAVAQATERRDGEVLEELLPRAERVAPALRVPWYSALAELRPTRRGAMLALVATLKREAGDLRGAVEALTALSTLEDEPHARAALNVTRGELLLHLNDALPARLAFERALADDPNQVVAVRELVELYRGNSELFAPMVERLAQLAGPEAIAALRAPLAEAYEALGRLQDAYATWGQLDETEEHLRHRAALAGALNLTGEALFLRERLAHGHAELQVILRGYLEHQLMPSAVRLAEQLLAEGALPPELARLAAERFAGDEQGAPLAVRLWPALLRQKVADADAWTLLAVALRTAGRATDAALADGFGAALVDSTEPAPLATALTMAPVDAPDAPDAPMDSVPVTDATMPRLASALNELLGAFHLPPRTMVLDPAGGVEAWKAAGDTLVIGAGALGVFGSAELAWLLALAEAMGPHGQALRALGDVPALAEAAVQAFHVYPSSLGAARVVAHLDGRVRGGDPMGVVLSQVLPDSPVFRALALAALEPWSR